MKIGSLRLVSASSSWNHAYQQLYVATPRINYDPHRPYAQTSLGCIMHTASDLHICLSQMYRVDKKWTSFKSL